MNKTATCQASITYRLRFACQLFHFRLNSLLMHLGKAVEDSMWKIWMKFLSLGNLGIKPADTWSLCLSICLSNKYIHLSLFFIYNVFPSEKLFYTLISFYEECTACNLKYKGVHVKYTLIPLKIVFNPKRLWYNFKNNSFTLKAERPHSLNVCKCQDWTMQGREARNWVQTSCECDGELSLSYHLLLPRV